MKFIISLLVGSASTLLIFMLGTRLISSAGFAGLLLGFPLLIIMVVVLLGSIIAGILLQTNRITVNRIELKRIGILFTVFYILAFFLILYWTK